MSVTVPSSVSTANVDSAGDDPKLARPDIKTLFDAVNTLLGQINALGIMQLGDGLENDAQAGGTKDKARVKLDGTSLARSSSGLKVNAVTTAMLETGTGSPSASTYYGTNGSSVKGFFSLPSGGEVNTGSNLGSGGANVFSGKSGVDLQFRQIKHSVTNATSGTGDILANCDLVVTVTTNTNDITFAFTLTRYKTAGGVGVGGL